MFKTIKSKFIFFAIFLIILTTAIPMYFLVSQLRQNFEDRSIEMIGTTLDVTKYGLKFAMMTGRQEDIENIIKDISRKTKDYRIRIVDSIGVIKYSSATEEINRLIKDIAPEHNNLERENVERIKTLGDKIIYSNFEPMFNEKRCQSCHGTQKIIGFLDIDTDLTDAENKFYTGSTHMIFLGWVVISLLIIGLYLIFNKLINIPLQNLITALNNVGAGNLETTIPINKNDEIGDVYKQFNSMTFKLNESKERINQLHQEELQRVDRLKTLGELTSQTAHEINNHIAIMMSRIEYLKMDAEKVDQLNNYSEDLDALLDQTVKVSEITKSILKYSKKKRQIKESVDLAEVIDKTILILEPILNKKDIKVIKEIKSGDYLISADSVQINQLLTNLINNASEAIGKSGTIKVKLELSDKNEIQLTVWDNGCGIDSEKLNEIFSPFFTTKTKEDRTGLGLYIVKKICDNHNATITCNSIKDQETSFIITFKNSKKAQ